jgi:hypothetical protein
MDLIKLFSGGFPMTIETLSFLQDAYSKPIKALSKLAGENTILEGIKEVGGVAPQGWFIRNGEPVFFKASALAGGTVRIIDKTSKVPYNEDLNADGNLDLKDAYVSRYATTDAGVLQADEVEVVSFPFTDLKPINSFKDLLPIGSAILWFDPLSVPAGYRIMDGTGGDIVRLSGTAKAYDLRDKFVKMAGIEGVANTTAGARTKTLVPANLPPHNHSIAEQIIYRLFGTGGARSDGGNDYLKTTDTDGNRSNKGYIIPATTTSSGTGLTSTPLNIEPSHYIAIWIQYIGL